MIYDIIAIALSLYFAILLRFDFGTAPEFDYYIYFFKLSVVPVIIITILFNLLFNLYDRLWKYASIEELLSIIYSTSISNIVFIIYSYFVTYKIFGSHYYRFPYTVHIIFWLLSVIAIGGIRFFYRIMETRKQNKSFGGSEKNLLIIGAGDAAAMLIKEIKKERT